MQVFFAVLSAIIVSRLIEWILIASLKTFKENQEKKLINKIEALKRAQQ